MPKHPSPQIGYNTNIRHRGRLFHLQTEDSGSGHPHVVTHLFADGGRVVATKKASYAQHLGEESCAATIRTLMQEQHKAMLIELRNGAHDEGDASAGAEALPLHSSASPPEVLRDREPEQATQEHAGVGPSVLRDQSLAEAILTYIADGLTDATARRRQL